MLSETLVGVFSSVEPEVARSEPGAAIIEALAEAAHRTRRDLASRPVQQAQMFSTLGTAMVSIDDRFDEPIELLREASELYRQELGTKAPETLSARRALGRALETRYLWTARASDRASAESYYAKQAEELLELLPSDHIEVQRVRLARASFGGDLETLKLLSAESPHAEIRARSLYRVANALSLAGNFEESEERFIALEEVSDSTSIFGGTTGDTPRPCLPLPGLGWCHRGSSAGRITASCRRVAG